MRTPGSLLRPAALLGALALAVTLPAAPGAAASAATHGHTPAAHSHHPPVPAHRPAARAGAAAAGSYAPAACGTAHHARQAQCYAMVDTNAQHRPAVSPADPPTGALGPADIQSAYNLPAGTAGSGETVAIVDAFGDSTAESDLAAFRSHYGLPACSTANGCFRKVDQTGGTGYPPDSPGTGWALETSLDLDAVSAACPNCSILLVEANTNAIPDLGAAVDEAVSLGAKFVSNSYGVLGEDASEQSFDPYYDHPGVAVAAATGDYGEITSYPAASPDVISVGGTTLTRDSSVSRGWDEAAWSGGGSGCSLYEPQPTYQQNVSTGCGNRAESDLSADADPNSGLAVYDTLGEGGWLQVGGTSLASPLITAMYALAGTPTAGTNPASYPHLDTHKPADLNDITQGSNGSCGTVLCTAGAGWDGPTGWGTPDGVSALTLGPTGDIAGQVTDKSTGRPVAGATVSAGLYSATTDSSGRYGFIAPVGSYTVTSQEFGYSTVKRTVQVTQDGTATENFAMKPIPTQTLSGTVRDGSGHGWPLYAKITIDGYPGGAVYTDPYTGAYSVALPQKHQYTLHVQPVYPGYTARTVQVYLGAASQVRVIRPVVDQTTCTAPGYAYQHTGSFETFTGWTGSTPQDGWTVADNAGNGQTWRFDNPGGRTPPPGGDADFAVMDSDYDGYGGSQDTSLVSPVVDMSQLTAPQIGFDTYYMGDYNQVGEVDLSLDGGQTWSSVWQQTSYGNVSGHVEIPIPQAAGQPDVQVRFHFTASYGWYWEIDNVLVGQQTCAPVRAGIVAGAVTDANTGDPLGTVTVASGGSTGGAGTSVAATDGTGLPTGYYWLVSTQTGSQSFTATDGTFTGTDGNYTPVTATVDVAPDAVTRQNWAMPAGQLTVSTHTVSATETLGGTKTAKITLGNDGTEPLRVTLGEHGEGVTPMASGPGGHAAGAPLHRVKVTGPVWFGAAARRPKSAAGATHPAQAGGPAHAGAPGSLAGVSGQAWASLADYPSEIMDSAVGYDDQTGTIYSAGGFNGNGYVASAYAFSPASQQWTPIAALPQALESAESAFIGGTFYVAGGWTQAGSMSTAVYAYDPSANTWSQVAAMPLGLAGGAATVLGGDMYLVGGCSTANCIPTSSAVYRFDPAAGRWTQLASYPAPVAFEACSGSGGEIACAGGENVNTTQATAATYLYDPAANTWTAGADMPYNDVGMSYSAANGDLQVVGGITANQTLITNQASQYDPVTGAWTALPNASDTVWRGSGGCGMYQLGGTTGLSFTPVSVTQALPGYDECGAQDVPWLSESNSTLDLAPGASATVTVTLGSAALTQPGTYTADLAIGTDSPYFAPPVAVSLTVTPPKSWGKIAGTVTDASTGQPIAGASLQICTMYDKTTGACGPVSYSLQTSDTGTYQLWLAKGYNPLQAVASMNGYQAQVARMTVTPGATTTRNFALQPAPPP